ncbi:MAG: hypothetical protein JO060_10885 [Candidatus Eremiobacteraeota bacterium]|nr:hypothetical protein [Candidatus Eremiobacteraeota bacterium]MBV9646974.1 hypothetical protein [Candidatus Eremiobacteraeota bacterium]
MHGVLIAAVIGGAVMMSMFAQAFMSTRERELALREKELEVRKRELDAAMAHGGLQNSP